MSRVVRDKSERYHLLWDSSLGSLLLAFTVRLYSGERREMESRAKGLRNRLGRLEEEAWPSG